MGEGERKSAPLARRATDARDGRARTVHLQLANLGERAAGCSSPDKLRHERQER